VATQQIIVQRFSVMSSKSFHDVVTALEVRIARPDMNAFRNSITAAGTEAELEKVVQGAVGPLGLMEFTCFDVGEILRKERKELGAKAPQSLRRS
jgi:hypothetical protein